MPAPAPLRLPPDVDLQNPTPGYKPINQSDVAAVNNPPPPVFKPSQADVQAVSTAQPKTEFAAPAPFFTEDQKAETPKQQPIAVPSSEGFNITHFGYKGDKYLDPESAAGHGKYNQNMVAGYSVALNKAAVAKLNNVKPGEEFEYGGRKFRYDDMVPELYPDARIDIFDPMQEIDTAKLHAGYVPVPTGTDVEKSKQPAAFGMRVATPQDVQSYDNYVKYGGDPNAIPPYDRLAVQIAKDPNFLRNPQNLETFYQMVYKPLHAQNRGDELMKAVSNLGPSIGATVQNMGAASANAIELAKEFAQISLAKVLGQDKGASYEKLAADYAKRAAGEAQGLGQGVSDAWDFLSGTLNNIANLPRPLMEWTISDPQQREELDRKFASVTQNIVGTQQTVHGLAKGMQDLSAASYGMVSAHAKELVAGAEPDPRVVEGTATITNPLNYAGPLLEGARVVGAFKPIFVERFLNLNGDAIGAATKKAALDTTMLQPEGVVKNASNIGYAETANARAAFRPQQAAAEGAVQQTSNDVATQLTRLGKTEMDPGTATQFMSNVMQTGGKMLSGAADIASDIPDKFVRMVPGGPTVQKMVGEAFQKYVFGTALHHMGPLGGVVETVAEHLPEAGRIIGDLLQVGGKELNAGEASLPYFTRVAQQSKYLPRWVASALDHPALQTAASVARGGVAAAAEGAALGAMSNPFSPIAGAVGGAAQGGIFGMAGAGFGQWQKFQSPGEYLLQARGDWKRYRDTLPTAEKASFDKLSPSNQLILGQSMQHSPGLNVQYTNDPNGPRGMHYTNPSGQSNIQVNLAHPDSVIAGVLAHELTHAAVKNGQLNEVYDSLLGNSQRGQPGQYTLLDANGQPAIAHPDLPGHYATNAEFDNLRQQYTNALAQSGVPTSHLTDLHIAREIHAEHGVDYILGGGAVQDAASSFRGGLLNPNALKTAMAKIGYTFDGNGGMTGTPNSKISGTGLFQDLQRNDTFGKVAQTYYQTRFHDGQINSEEASTRRFSKADMRNDNVVQKNFTNSAEIKRDEQGRIVRNPLTGDPIYRSKGEVEKYNADFAAAINHGLESLPPDRLNELGYRKTGDNTFVRYLPTDVLDAVAKTNKYNPHQIASLRMLSNILADKGSPGAVVNFFYHKALSEGKKYGQFSGTEKSTVPYGFELTKDGNIDIKSADLSQLTNNYMKVRNRPQYKALWGDSVDQFTQDAHTYFTNHSQGLHGADGGLGTEKRDAINALAGFGTTLHKDSNPLVEKMPKSVRSIIKSYRIDRANQITATDSVKPFISEEQYRRMNENYLPRQEESQHPMPVTPQHAAALPSGTKFLDPNGKLRKVP